MKIIRVKDTQIMPDGSFQPGAYLFSGTLYIKVSTLAHPYMVGFAAELFSDEPQSAPGTALSMIDVYRLVSIGSDPSKAHEYAKGNK